LAISGNYNAEIIKSHTMNAMTAILVKTPLGRAEIGSKALGLPVMERRLLILVDGTRSLVQLQGMFNIPVMELANKLQALGLVDSLSPAQPQAAPVNAPASAPAAIATIPAALARVPVAPLQPPVLVRSFATLPVQNLAEPIEYADQDIGVDVDLDAALAEDLASDFLEEQGSDWLDKLDDQTHQDSDKGDTQPGLLTHRAASSLGLITGKAYLIETVETMLAKDGGWLVRKISSAQTEAELYYALEQLVTTIGVYTSQSSVKGIVRRFEEKISQR
jgi:hypothetical protein